MSPNSFSRLCVASHRATFGRFLAVAKAPHLGKPLMSLSGRRLPALIIGVAVLTGGLAQALDLDLDKSGAQLFAANCTTCHHSPRGLAKNKFSWTLQYFLQQHYTTSPALAQTLTAYLQSVDAPRSKPQSAVHKWRSSETKRIRATATPPFAGTGAIDFMPAADLSLLTNKSGQMPKGVLLS
jgi:hypothetical protein